MTTHVEFPFWDKIKYFAFFHFISFMTWTLDHEREHVWFSTFGSLGQADEVSEVCFIVHVMTASALVVKEMAGRLANGLTKQRL